LDRGCHRLADHPLETFPEARRRSDPCIDPVCASYVDQVLTKVPDEGLIVAAAEGIARPGVGP
jgi:hypothetical protein